MKIDEEQLLKDALVLANLLTEAGSIGYLKLYHTSGLDADSFNDALRFLLSLDVAEEHKIGYYRMKVVATN